MQRTVKSFVMDVLNGSALGIVVALIPGALLGELLKALVPSVPALSGILQIVNTSNTFVGFAVGIAIAVRFKFNPIEMISVAIAVMIAGGSVQYVDSAIQLKGTGDMLTMCATAAVAVGVILWMQPYVKGYAILIVPTVSIIVAASVGSWLYPYFTAITALIGQTLKELLTLEQTVLAVIIAVVFACLVISPISSVGLAIAIGISGVGSGAANLGICACAFALAVAGRRVNSLGTCLAHFIGSPKLSMPNAVAHPKLFIPIIINAAIMGLVASIFNIQGTAFSAGFGLSGLIGPVNHLNDAGWTIPNVLVAVLSFVVLPVVLAWVTDYIMVTRLQMIDPESYRIKLN